MKEARIYKTPILASRFIKALRRKQVRAKAFEDNDCYPNIYSASLSEDVGFVCAVTYRCIYNEDSPTRGVSAGYYRFELLGVVYEGSRSFYLGNDREAESLLGRPIKYDTNPETGNVYTKEDVFKVIADTVRFDYYNPDDYPCRLNGRDLSDIADCLLQNYAYDGDDSDGRYYALSEEGEVYLFDEKMPMPENEGFRRISSREAIEIIVDKQQKFEEDYC